MPEEPRVTVARYLKDSVVALAVLALLVLIGWFCYISWLESSKKEKTPTIKCPACGAELELKKADERSKK